MSDLIDRQQAIDALKNRWLKTRNYEGIGEDIAEECEIYLRTVPSIQFATDTNVGTKLGTNLISRQTVLDAIDEISREVDDGDGFDYAKWREYFYELPSAEPKIIYCKDCRKHNKRVGFDENFHTVWKEDACPLASWRGKAQGHEFDYQFCCFAERREVTT